jgi:threonyl-tRNA synthetase
MFVTCNNKSIEIGPSATVKELADSLNLREPHQAVAAKVNGTSCDLTHRLNDGDTVELLNFEDKEGKELFWHSSAHILAQAVLRLYPNALPTIGPAIENGFYYDFANLSISEDDFPKIEKEAQKIIQENHKTKRYQFASKEEALEKFKNNPFKVELIEKFESGPITAYEQGEFFDLCRGPHLFSLGKVKAFKLLKTSGAYWHADKNNEMLTRIYGITFPSKEELKQYLDMLEEAKKRDHKLLGQKLDLFSIKEFGPGMPFIHPKGMIIWNRLLDFWRKLHYSNGYVEIKTPMLLSKELWEISGHWFHYKENMYTSEIEDKEFAIKPMNCPGGMLYYKSDLHSYRELPMRVGEIGHVHRHEFSGALNGLFRVRSFHQDDAHVFMTKDQIKDEILEVLKLVDTIYTTFGLTYKLFLSTRPEKSKTIGSDEDWEIATNGLKDALEASNHPYAINEGDGAFYGPKIDLQIRDALGRSWQCGTIQLDMSLPEKFELEYTDRDGSKKRPVMIHRAIFGSIERFFAILIEHFAGRFPLWISPIGIRIIPVAERHIEYARQLKKSLESLNIPMDIDESEESVSKKIRNAQLQQINYMLTVGDQEMQNETLSLRTRENLVVGEMNLDSFKEAVTKEFVDKSLVSGFQNVKVNETV